MNPGSVVVYTVPSHLPGTPTSLGREQPQSPDPRNASPGALRAQAAGGQALATELTPTGATRASELVLRALASPRTPGAALHFAAASAAFAKPRVRVLSGPHTRPPARPDSDGTLSLGPRCRRPRPPLKAPAGGSSRPRGLRQLRDLWQPPSHLPRPLSLCPYAELPFP